MKILFKACVAFLIVALAGPMWSQPAGVRGLDVAQVKFSPPDSHVDLDLFNSGSSPVAAYGIITHTVFADGSESQIYLTRDLTTLIVAQRVLLNDSEAKGLPDSSPLKGLGPGRHFREDSTAQTSTEHGVPVGFRAEPMFVIFMDGSSSSNGEPIAAQYMAQQRAAWRREAQAFQKWLPEIKTTFGREGRGAKVADIAELMQRMRADGVNDGYLGEMARMPPLSEALSQAVPPVDARSVAYLESYMKALDERALLVAALASTGGK